MDAFTQDFNSRLAAADKETCVNMVISRLESGQIDIGMLYNGILTPALNEPFCQDNQEVICIWEEHVRSSIIRTIIECCYPYVIKERDQRQGANRKGKVIVVCPTREFHEIGARMVADYFTVAGFDTTFVGANTPQDEIIEAIEFVKPDYVSISVSASYNLVAGRRIIRKIMDVRSRTNQGFKIVIGGHAFDRNPEQAGEMGADLHLKSREEILNLEGSK